MSDNDTQKGSSGNGAGQIFHIQKIYIKDISFESPNAPKSFSQQSQPDIQIELDTKTSHLEADIYDVLLSVTVTAKKDNRVLFIVEVQQGGLFIIKGFNQQELPAMLGSFCPNILFPYVRETVSDLVTRGGFPPLLLSPVNFDALYAQHLERLKEKQQQASPPDITTH